MNVLAIDDNPDLTELLDVSLNAMGHQVETTNNAKDGLELVTKKKYDIVLLDINMPNFTGIDFVNSLVKNNIIKDHKIVLFTSSLNTSNEVSELLKKGVLGCIEKPIEVDALEEQLEKFSQKSKTNLNQLEHSFKNLKDDAQKELLLKFLINFSSEKVEELESVKQELEKTQYDKLLIVLADDLSRKIIQVLVDEELTALHISKKLGIPQTTTYRKIRKLEELQLIKKSKVVRSKDGVEESYYKSWTSEINVKIKDGKILHSLEKIKLNGELERIWE